MAFEAGYNLYDYYTPTFYKYVNDQTIFVKAAQFINSFGSEENIIKNQRTIRIYLENLLSYRLEDIYLGPGKYISMYVKQEQEKRIPEDSPYRQNNHQVDLVWDPTTTNPPSVRLGIGRDPDTPTVNLTEKYGKQLPQSFANEITAFTLAYMEISERIDVGNTNPEALYKISYEDYSGEINGVTFHRVDGKEMRFDIGHSYLKDEFKRVLSSLVDKINE